MHTSTVQVKRSPGPTNWLVSLSFAVFGMMRLLCPHLNNSTLFQIKVGSREHNITRGVFGMKAEPPTFKCIRRK